MAKATITLFALGFLAGAYAMQPADEGMGYSAADRAALAALSDAELDAVRPGPISERDLYDWDNPQRMAALHAEVGGDWLNRIQRGKR